MALVRLARLSEGMRWPVSTRCLSCWTYLDSEPCRERCMEDAPRCTLARGRELNLKIPAHATSCSKTVLYPVLQPECIGPINPRKRGKSKCGKRRLFCYVVLRLYSWRPL